MQPINTIKKSNDGSHTLFSEKFQVTYHSLHGATTESQVVFIDAGLNYFQNRENKTEISVFEMGFGTGLNAFMTALWAEKNKVSIQYTGIEAYPIANQHLQELNYPAMLGRTDIFESIHNAAWGSMQSVTTLFKLHKIKTTLQAFIPVEESVDIIFYDAFGPGAQPELWETGLMTKNYSILKKGGILVTYCSQGQFRRNLKVAGFIVDKLPGPPGKREIVRAYK